MNYEQSMALAAGAEIGWLQGGIRGVASALDQAVSRTHLNKNELCALISQQSAALRLLETEADAYGKRKLRELQGEVQS